MPQSLQCPRCQSLVSVEDDAGGRRVVCPKCQQSFLVPGSTNSAADAADSEDDWLTLEDSPPPTAGPAAGTGGGGSGFRDDTFGDDPFGDDFADVPPPPSQPEAGTDTADDDWDADFPPLAPLKQRSGSGYTESPLGGDGPLPDTGSGPTPPKATDIELETDYNVRCPVCETICGVTAAQAGKKINCHDCHSKITVPPPPRKKKKPQIDLETAESFRFNPSKVTESDRPDDPFRKSAHELLAAAEKGEREEPKQVDDDIPKIGEWLNSLFGIFRQLGVTVHWLILSAIGSVAAFVVINFASPITTLAMVPVAIFLAIMTLACGFQIMQSIANDEETVSDWPFTLELGEWVGPMVYCFFASAIAVSPGWAIGHVTFGESLASVFLIMGSVFVIFPFVLLSMLDMQSLFVPFSPEVGRSVTRCEDAWGAFYLSSLILFFTTFLCFAFLRLQTVFGTSLCLLVGIGATFAYFSLLGRLAYAIGHTLNDEPMINDISSVRESEREHLRGPERSHKKG